MGKNLLNIVKNLAFKALEENIGDAFPVLWYEEKNFKKYKIQRPSQKARKI